MSKHGHKEVRACAEEVHKFRIPAIVDHTIKVFFKQKLFFLKSIVYLLVAKFPMAQKYFNDIFYDITYTYIMI